jgi:hypothetical protein
MPTSSFRNLHQLKNIKRTDNSLAKMMPRFHLFQSYCVLMQVWADDYGQTKINHLEPVYLIKNNLKYILLPIQSSRFQRRVHVGEIVNVILLPVSGWLTWTLFGSINVIVVWPFLFDHAGHRSWTRCDTIFKQEPLQTTDGWRRRCAVRCLHLQVDATWLGESLLPSGCGSHATRGETHPGYQFTYSHFQVSSCMWLCCLVLLIHWIRYIFRLN